MSNVFFLLNPKYITIFLTTGSSASGSSDRRHKGAPIAMDKNSDKKSGISESGSETETGGSVIFPPHQTSMPDISTIPGYARGPPGGPPLPLSDNGSNGGAPPPGQLAQTNADLAGSRQSFKMAMGNPCK